MKRHAKAGITMTFIISMVLLFSEACQKESAVHATDPGNIPGAPALPPTLYDYSTPPKMPAYIRDYIARNLSVDNTPRNNPITNEGATLGRVLFYDKKLSANNTVSCASCHHADKAFTDGKAASPGFQGVPTRRNSMSLVNLKYFKGSSMFWDLRASNLEEQVLMPFLDHIEMGIPSLSALEKKVQSYAYYPPLFRSAFGSDDINTDRISKALAQFIRSIASFNSRYDQGLSSNFSNFSPEELEGKRMVTRAFCTECHSDLESVAKRDNPTFLIVENFGLNTGNGSNNALDEKYKDEGIGEKTTLSKDMGTFKIPTLRNVELTAPYMHDGRFNTLEEVVEHYATGVKKHPNRGIQLSTTGFRFSPQEKKAIVSFLKTLTDQSLASEPRFSDPFQ